MCQDSCLGKEPEYRDVGNYFYVTTELGMYFFFFLFKSFFPATKLSPAPAAACEVHTSLTRAGLLQGAVGEEDYVNSTITLLLRSQ